MAKPTKTPDYLTRAGILTREQLRDCLGVSFDTIARWEEVDGFPSRTAGRTTFYDIDAIKAWIAAGPERAEINKIARALSGLTQ